MRLWPRVEILSAFVFWKLRRILYFGQYRVEIVGHPESFVRLRRTLGKPDRNDGVLRSAMGALGGPFWEGKVGLRRALMGCFAKFLMCVLAPVRIFSVVCFLGVTTNSVGGALSIRSGLDHLRICAEILEFCDGFKLGIDGL